MSGSNTDSDQLPVGEFVMMKRDECVSIFGDALSSGDDACLAALLVKDGDWSERGADALIELARAYGFWFLENALAVALALDIPDGSKGF